MTTYEANYLYGYELHARNTVTGETRNLHVCAANATAAYAKGFHELDAEAGDRSWCFDDYVVTHEPYRERP